MKPSQSIRYNRLHAIRGLASCCIALAHLVPYQSRFELDMPKLALVHQCAVPLVDLLFVLSGFVIAYVSMNQHGRIERIPSFLLRRLWRVYPIYWVAIALVLLGTNAIGWKLITGDADGHLWSWVCLLPSESFNSVIPPAWTMTYEVQFYVVFSLALALSHRMARVLFATWAVGVAIFAGLSLESSVWLHQTFSPFVLEFLSGVVAADLVSKGFTRFGRIAIISGVVLAGLELLILSITHSEFEFLTLLSRPLLRVLMFGPCAFLLIYGCAAIESRKPWAIPRWLSVTGDASYSIYLLHMPVQLIMLGLWSKWTVPPFAVAWWFPITFATSILSGLILHFAIERPVLAVGKLLKKARSSHVPTPRKETPLRPIASRLAAAA